MERTARPAHDPDAAATSAHRRRISVGRPERAPRRTARLGTADYYALGAIAIFLSGIGLVMVLSASSAELAGDGSNPYGDFITQLLATGAGLAALVFASRAPASFWMRAAPWLFGAAFAFQLLVVLTPLGTGSGGNTNWIQIGSLTVQPSELLKLALVLVVASFFARKDGALLRWRQLAGVCVLAGIAMWSVIQGKDMGTTIILAAMFVAGLYFGDVRLRLFVAPLLLLGLAAFVYIATRPSRLERVTAWLHGCNGSVTDACWQTTQGLWALAAGGITGVGIGNSVSKWFWLPEADNDFIVAVIGEETGLIGLVVLLGLFVALAVVFVRITGSTTDRFTRVATGMVLTWIVGQALVNVAVVLGFLPVLGVPLPFVSKGGSSMVATLAAIGCVMSLANAPLRRDPAGPAVAPLPEPAPPPDPVEQIRRAHPDHPSLGRARTLR